MNYKSKDLELYYINYTVSTCSFRLVGHQPCVGPGIAHNALYPWGIRMEKGYGLHFVMASSRNRLTSPTMKRRKECYLTDNTAFAYILLPCQRQPFWCTISIMAAIGMVKGCIANALYWKSFFVFVYLTESLSSA